MYYPKVIKPVLTQKRETDFFNETPEGLFVCPDMTFFILKVQSCSIVISKVYKEVG